MLGGAIVDDVDVVASAHSAASVSIATLPRCRPAPCPAMGRMAQVCCKPGSVAVKELRKLRTDKDGKIKGGIGKGGHSLAGHP